MIGLQQIVKVMVIIAGYYCVSSCQTLVVLGKALAIAGVSDDWSPTGNAIVMLDAQTLDVDTLLTNARQNFGFTGNASALRAPSFSPDGKKIVFIAVSPQGQRALYIADNNGANITKICNEVYNRQDADLTIDLNWVTDGYIYWSECTDEVFRVNSIDKQIETVWTNVGVRGYTEDYYVHGLSMSTDGKRGQSQGHGFVNALDMVNHQVVGVYPGGCHGTITSDGNYIIEVATCCIPFPPGAVGAATSVWINRFESSLGPNIADHYTYVLSPNVVAGAEFVGYRSSTNNADYFVAMGQGVVNSGRCMLFRISSQEHRILGGGANSQHLGIWPSDFWYGTLPEPPASGPRITLSPTSLVFLAPAGIVPDAQTVTAGNSGIDVLHVVDVTTSPLNISWLNIVPDGLESNSQMITNSVDVSSLSNGVYSALVTVTSNNAGNSQNYAISLNVGKSVAAPTSLSALVSGQDVILTWQDNSPDETGFIIERMTGTGAWTELATTTADATTFHDPSLTPESYAYRIKAIGASDTSWYSNTVHATIYAIANIKVISPKEMDTCTARDTVLVMWTAQNSSVVFLEYSLNGGLSFSRVQTNGAISLGDADWGAFPWVVPDTFTNEAIVSVCDYQNPTIRCYSDLFIIVKSSAVHANSTTTFLRNGIHSVHTSAQTGNVRIGFSVPVVHDNIHLSVYRVNGSLVKRITVLSDNTGEQFVTVPSLPSGLYLIRLTDAHGILYGSSTAVSTR